MRLTVGTSKAPGNLHVYNFESKELKRVTNTLNPEINVEYVVFPDEGRGVQKNDNEIKGYGEILTFLDKYLAGRP